MNKENYKIYIYANIGLFVAVIFIFALISKPIKISDWLTIISKALSLTVLASFVFVKWLWKCSLFYSWLVPFPDLSGEWSGIIKTTYNDEDMQIPLIVIITQDFFKVTVRLKTGESWSISNGAYFPTDADGKITHLYYTYMNTPNQDIRNRSEIHYGTTRLDFYNYPVESMEGEYWTSRRTVGRIDLKRERNKH